MTKKQVKQLKNFRIVAVFSLIVIILVLGIKILYKPNPAEIFVVDTAPLQYGDVSLTGRIQKDTAVGVEGNYFLIMPNQKPILLDVAQDMDSFVEQTVTIGGTLFPENASGQPITLKVISIKVQ